MAIIKEYKTAKGVTIKFNDIAYADKLEEEREQLRKNVDKTLSLIFSKRMRGTQ